MHLSRFAKLLSETKFNFMEFNLLNTKLNPTCHLLALLGAHHILHVSRIRVKGVVLSAFS